MGGAEFRLPLLVTIFRYTLRRAVSLNLAISFLAVVVAAVSRWALAKQAPLASVALVAGCMMVGGTLRRVVVPMGLGTVLGSAAGGLLIAYVPAGAVKLLLGIVLIASALRVFKVRRSSASSPGSSARASG